MASPMAATHPGPAGGAAPFVPAPPKLAYANNSLRTIRTASAKSRTSSGSRPVTASRAVAAAEMERNKSLAPSPKRPGSATSKAKKTFLQDNEAVQQILPQPLPPGIPFVASFTTFDDLIERKILAQPGSQQVRLTTDDVRLMYDAKCEDQKLKPSWDREMRFLGLICNSCRGQHFRLRENGLGPRSAEAISRVLAHNETFTVLELSGNAIKDDGAKSIASLLASNDILVHCGLKSNDIGADGIVALCEVLATNCTLTSLDLGGIRGVNRNHIGGRGAAALGDLLRSNEVLHTLDISSNGLGVVGCGLVAGGLEHNHALRRLYLSGNNLGPDGCQLLAATLQNCRLEVVDLRRNEIGDVGAAHLANAFAPGTPGGEHILTLHLDHNNIREAGCRALAPMLRKNQSLKNAFLSNNNMGPGLSLLFEGLRDNRKLEKLTVVNTGMQAAEAKALAKSLEGGAGISFIDISRNRMEDAGGAAIFDALTGNTRLQSIVVAGCSFGNQTAEAISRMLGHNKTLTSMDCKQNLFGGKVGDVLLEQLKLCDHVRCLDLAYNDIPYLAQSGINTVLQRNAAAWKKGESSRLEKQIEELDYAQRELFQVEEDIVSERRAFSEKQEELTRRKEAGRGQAELNRRAQREVEERLAAVKAVAAERENDFRLVHEELRQQEQRMEVRLNHLRNKIEAERSAGERALREAERLRKQLKTAHEKQDLDLKPLVQELESLEQERQNDLHDAIWQAETVAELELRILQLEHALKLAPDRNAGAGHAGTGASTNVTPRRAAARK